MADKSHGPDDRHLRELSDAVRPAVEQVRNQPAPAAAQRRALERARRIGQRPARPWLSRRGHLVAAGTIAALLLLGLALVDVPTTRPAPGEPGEIAEALSAPGLSKSSVGPKDERWLATWQEGERSHAPFPDEPLVELQSARVRSTPGPRGEGRDFGGGLADGRSAEAKKWGGLPERDRARALSELTRGLPPPQRAAVERYFKRLGQPGIANKPSGTAKGPEVWKRDAGRPAFARVYVGDGNSLELVSLHVTATVEGPRARTVVDHVFRNPHDRRLEGTFEYPLPIGASPSYFAMFLGQTTAVAPPRFARRGGAPALPEAALAPQQLVRQVDTREWGKLQEGRVVAQDKAREAYEDIVRGQIDPALLEHAGGNGFLGRVFPIPPRGFNRVVLAYEETLPVVGERLLYRFPLPGRKLSELRFHLQARASECRAATALPAELKKGDGDGRLTFSHTWKDEAPAGAVAFSCEPARLRVQTTSGRHGPDGPRYLYARLRPALPEAPRPEPFARHGVFLLDTSLSEHPGRFAVSMRLLKAILEGDRDLKHFNILAFNAGACWVEPGGWLPNTRAGRDKALARLDGLVLEGATDLSAALERLSAPDFAVERGTPLSCFLLSDGHLTWGETDVAALVARFERRCPFPVRWHCYRTGLGEENAELFDALTRTGGGTFQCFNAAEVASAARAHRRHCLRVERVRVVGHPAAREVLVAGRRAAVYPGGELVVAAQFTDAGRATVVVEGTFQGKKWAQEYPVLVKDDGELAPRGWGEVAVASLLALHDPNLDGVVTAYCQEFGIASRQASFLVLENEADYKRLNLEAERGRTLKGDLGHFVEQAWSQLGREVSGRQALARLLTQVDGRTKVLSGPDGAAVRDLLALLSEEECEVPALPVAGTLLRRRDADKRYLAARAQDRRDVHAYLAEGERRAGQGDLDGAVRVLSSVVEKNPGRGEALRLVGYRLLALHQPAQAAKLFGRVQRQRPFEPHSYRDLARSLEQAGRYGLAAVQYETVLAGSWHGRFGASLKEVAREEYVQMMRQAVRTKRVRPALAEHFGRRLEKLGPAAGKADLRVTITWNTDATDVDLWVIEPDGTKVFYSARRSKNGGELSQDMTQGYGPERYQIAQAPPGEYQVIVHYFRANPNLLGGETHVDVLVQRHAGSTSEQVQRRTVILRRHTDQVTAFKVKF
jgi:Flp pilus assembly protein TadD